MELRQIGPRGPAVSRLALGSTKFGRRDNVKYPHDFELPTDRQLQNLFSIAKEHGINLIDTAPAYGSSERRIGTLIGDDAHWHIATKVGEIFENGVSRFDFSAEAIRCSVAQSRDALRRGTLDFVLLHLPDDDIAVLQDGSPLATLQELRDQGVITAIGASTKTVAAGLWAVDHFDLVMIALNPADQSQRPVLEAAYDKGKGVLIKKPLDSGHSGEPSKTLRDLVCQPAVGSVVVGTINAKHLTENCAAVEQVLSSGKRDGR